MDPRPERPGCAPSVAAFSACRAIEREREHDDHDCKHWVSDPSWQERR
jgi:hypothetical protein